MPRGWVPSLIAALLCCAASAHAGSAGVYYVNSGTVLNAVDGDPVRASYSEWQVWLYPRAVVPRYGSSLFYGRWGVVHAHSARAVMDELAALEEYERAYKSFFGPNSWGPFTFSYPIGPIALASTDAPALTSDSDLLAGRLTHLVEAVMPSLRNGQPGTASQSVEAYFEQLRDSLASMVRFYDKAFRLPNQNSYLTRALSQLPSTVRQLENRLPELRAALPSVALPANKGWMSQAAGQGSDGTLAIAVKEADSGVVVRQSWSGGDGKMSGTVVETFIRYRDIGNLKVWLPLWAGPQRWTLHIEAASQRGFPQSLTSPERKTPQHTYAPVNLTTSESSIYLEFSNPSDAQNAYTFFLYHTERGS
ncbi:MAG TPA: hypothetical protein VEJ67_12255 [Candidatus Cybelea sp.]|nr:hypothetical protein [Candidatus Cybelea sp.]